MPKKKPTSKGSAKGGNTKLNAVEYVVAGTMTQSTERIGKLLLDPDPALRADVIALIIRQPWSSWAARQFWCDLLFLGMCLGEPEDIEPLRSVPQTGARSSVMIEWIAKMRELVARVIALRNGLEQGPAAPTDPLPSTKAKLHQALLRHLGAPNWNPTEALVEVIRTRKFARQDEEGLLILATLLLHGKPEQMHSLQTLSNEVPALTPLLKAKGLSPAGSAPLSDDLLERVYANPSDDGPRFVYADWLLEQNDPRGEFINAQLSGTVEPKMTKRQRIKWLDALGAVVRTDRPIRYRRGFVSGVTVSDFEPGDTARAWSTIEVVDLTGRGRNMDAIPLPQLRAVGGVSSALLDNLHEVAPGLSAIALKRIRKADRHTVWDALLRFEGLKHLYLANYPTEAGETLSRAPLVDSLQTLIFHGGCSEHLLSSLPPRLRVLTVGAWNEAMWLEGHRGGEYLLRQGTRTQPLEYDLWRSVLFPPGQSIFRR